MRPWPLKEPAPSFETAREFFARPVMQSPFPTFERSEDHFGTRNPCFLSCGCRTPSLMHAPSHCWIKRRDQGNPLIKSSLDEIHRPRFPIGEHSEFPGWDRCKRGCRGKRVKRFDL